MELMRASREWATRPGDQRFTSLTDLHAHCVEMQDTSRSTVVSSRKLEVRPTADDQGLQVFGPNGHGYEPSHYSFGQLAELAKAPPAYLRKLPPPMAADCINYGMRFEREPQDVGVLIRKNTDERSLFRAATGPNYGRIWNATVTEQLTDRFGDGVSGDWRVPGEFGKAVTVTKANTTLYASDRDMFVFLADEVNRIEVPKRRDGKSGSLARGFFAWNSEVGSTSLGLGFFIFDYTCSNRIVWGATQYREVRVRHTASAPDRWLEEVAPALAAYREESADPIQATIMAAQAKKVDDVAEFLRKRNFSTSAAKRIMLAHEEDEGRPMETLWDVATGMTAHARSITHQDDRVALERQAGLVLDLAAA
jgi:hypothetical protein